MEPQLAEPDTAGSGDRPDVARRVGSSVRRRRWAAVLAVLSLGAAAAGGFAAGRLVQSPDEEAASRVPPPPSVITAAVQRGPLAAELVGRGTIGYSVTTEIVLGGPVSGDVTRQVVTSARSLGEEVQEGSVVMEISGRPLFAFAGPAPVYRSLSPGASGRDVEQLQEALRRLGYRGVRLTRVFDYATQLAVAALYKDAGYPAAVQAEPDLAVTFPAGEMTFVPQLPMKVVTAEKAVGATAEGVLAQLAGGALQVEGTLNRADAALVRVGMKATLATDDRAFTFDGEVSVVSALAAAAGGTPPSGEFRIVVKPTPEVPAGLQAGAPLRISLPVGASGEDSLVVPVVAVVTRADGRSTVTVARGGAGTDAVPVSVGLAANGLVTVTPIDGGRLAIEDRVVVSHVPQP